MDFQRGVVTFALLVAMAETGRAQIYRWDTGEVIPGTEGIELGPGVELSSDCCDDGPWNTDGQNLRYADFSGDLSNALFDGSWLDDARFNGANLTNASLSDATLTRANFSGANLTNAVLHATTLTDANLSGAVVTGANFNGTGLTEAQLASTSSYEAKDLSGISLSRNDLTGWDLSGQNLSNASLDVSTLTDADLSGANLTHAAFSVGLPGANLTGANLGNANLTNATLTASTLTDANLDGAVVAGASFGLTTGFTQAQLASTASYQAKDLTGIRLWAEDLTGWDLSGQDLTNAILHRVTLPNVNLSGANLKNADLETTRHFHRAIFSSDTIYNQWTVFPANFDPVASGLVLMPSPLGDFDGDDVLDVADIEMMQQRVRMGSVHDMFDLNNDGFVTRADITAWVQDLNHTWFGDANLDGEFNTVDLVQVFAAGKYEATTERGPWGNIVNPATWSTGDWNTDGEFTSSDLVLAFQDGGYEAGPRPVVAAVPEPSGFLVLALGLYGLLRIHRHAMAEHVPS